MAINQEQLETLVRSIRLEDPHFISGYGSLPARKEQGDEVLAGPSPASLLAGKLAEIVERLSDADPRKAVAKPGKLAILSGAALESNLRRMLARKTLDTLLVEAERAAMLVREGLRRVEASLQEIAEEVAQLQLSVEAGRRFLQENPQAGMPVMGEVSFDNPRERFARKLANLATLKASQEMGIAQLHLGRAQALDLLDRFDEVRVVLIPVWKQHTQAVETGKNVSSDVMAAANKAHEALVRSLVALKG